MSRVLLRVQYKDVARDISISQFIDLLISQTTPHTIMHDKHLWYFEDSMLSGVVVQHIISAFSISTVIIDSNYW